MVPKWFSVTNLLASLLLIAGSSMGVPSPRQEACAPPGDSVAVTMIGDVVFAIDDLGAMVNLDADDAATLTSDVRAVVETDQGHAFALYGSATMVEAVMAAAVGVLPVATTVPATTGTADAHPKQPVVVFELEKKWTDEKGIPRVRKAKLEVEKRPGESTEEHVDRAERELDKWEKKGWSTV